MDTWTDKLKTTSMFNQFARWSALILVYGTLILLAASHVSSTSAHMEALCDDRDTVVASVTGDTWREIPYLVTRIANTPPNVYQMVEVYVNKEEGTSTIIQTDARSNQSCVLHVGIGTRFIDVKWLEEKGV